MDRVSPGPFFSGLQSSLALFSHWNFRYWVKWDSLILKGFTLEVSSLSLKRREAEKRERHDAARTHAIVLLHSQLTNYPICVHIKKYMYTYKNPDWDSHPPTLYVQRETQCFVPPGDSAPTRSETCYTWRFTPRFERIIILSYNYYNCLSSPVYISFVSNLHPQWCTSETNDLWHAPFSKVAQLCTLYTTCSQHMQLHTP